MRLELNHLSHESISRTGGRNHFNPLMTGKHRRQTLSEETHIRNYDDTHRHRSFVSNPGRQGRHCGSSGTCSRSDNRVDRTRSARAPKKSIFQKAKRNLRILRRVPRLGNYFLSMQRCSIQQL
jgi:hypothetical protein